MISPEVLLGLAAILAAVALLIRTNAMAVSALAAKYDALLERQHASELAYMKSQGELTTQIAALKVTIHLKDEALDILRRMEPQVIKTVSNSTLANQQLTTLQRDIAYRAQPDDTTAADAAHAANVLKDYNATQGNAPVVMPIEPTSPVIPDGVGVSLVGTLTVDHKQEVPPLPTPPSPIGAIDPLTGEAVKIA